MTSAVEENIKKLEEMKLKAGGNLANQPRGKPLTINAYIMDIVGEFEKDFITTVKFTTDENGFKQLTQRKYKMHNADCIVTARCRLNIHQCKQKNVKLDITAKKYKFTDDDGNSKSGLALSIVSVISAN